MDEKRSSPRAEPRRRLACRLTAPSLPGGLLTLVRDLSAGGVGLHVAVRLDVGMAAQLIPLGQPAEPIPLTVVQVREVPGGFLAGCAFDRSLTAEQLTALLGSP